MRELRFVSSDELQELERRGGPVVVAFLATWNRRCQEFSLAYEAFAARHGARLPVVCVDVDEFSALAAAREVFSIPTLLLLRDGVEVHREAGLDLGPFEELLRSDPAGG